MNQSMILRGAIYWGRSGEVQSGLVPLARGRAERVRVSRHVCLRPLLCRHSLPFFHGNKTGVCVRTDLSEIPSSVYY